MLPAVAPAGYYLVPDRAVFAATCGMLVNEGYTGSLHGGANASQQRSWLSEDWYDSSYDWWSPLNGDASQEALGAIHPPFVADFAVAPSSRPATAGFTNHKESSSYFISQGQSLPQAGAGGHGT